MIKISEKQQPRTVLVVLKTISEICETRLIGRMNCMISIVVPIIAPTMADKKIFVENFLFLKCNKLKPVPNGMSMNELMMMSESGRLLKLVEKIFLFLFSNFKEIEIVSFEILMFAIVPIVRNEKNKMRKMKSDFLCNFSFLMSEICKGKTK